MFDILEADIVVFQETKIQRKDLSDDMVLVPGWDCYFSLPRHKKGEVWSYNPRHLAESLVKVTPALLSTRDKPRVPPSALKKASLESFVPRTRLLFSPTYQKSNK